MTVDNTLHPIPEGAETLTLNLPHLQLAALAWGDPDGKPLLALHGWLDNAMTFARLAPVLAKVGYRVVAPDFAGHGYSDWRPAGQTYLLMENCFDVQAAALALGWSRFTLIGHSMGAGVASLLAGAHPEVVEKLVMLDGIGSLTTPDEEAAAQLGRALGRWIGHQEKYAESDPLSAFSARIYASVQDAAEARMKGVGAVDFDAALMLCQRALRQVDETHQAGGWFWRSDSRLRHPSPWRLTEAQNLSFMKAIQAPTLLVEAQQGLLINRPEIETRFQALTNAQKSVLEGGHHLHLETGSCDAVAEVVVKFLQ
ncbi:alpha/beta fold hydrolase [Marinospirillum alkaliphilum]|uniref:Pimeloyl-ACP methyl ester carboxylesterase n=1 Tax=Marinospirillum alkaliphilum DSM 21637 TaxID=1122209 RepID=A0A1K1U1S1_9GAMM|nr:alpha/beta hydrolase [Marinospirillum alkaliphilum]SFX06704.1 Pimeloyl-ACP methyl ester carboxylesterase [Marinospirillum alkaliphilum DSM 21637]